MDQVTSVALVKQALAEELSRYAVTPIPPSRVKQISLELRSLEDIETVLYPTAFFCLKCRKLYGEEPGNNEFSVLEAGRKLQRRFPNKLQCECGGRLIQWRVLTVHDCGETIHIPTFFFAKCAKHGFDALYFDNHGSERLKNWEIVCRADGCGERKGFGLFFYYHKDCPLKGPPGSEGKEENRFLRYETAPIQKATNFLPKVLKILNSNRLSMIPRAGKDSSALALGALRASQYFSLYRSNDGMEGWIEQFNSQGNDSKPCARTNDAGDRIHERSRRAGANEEGAGARWPRDERGDNRRPRLWKVGGDSGLLGAGGRRIGLLIPPE